MSLCSVLVNGWMNKAARKTGRVFLVLNLKTCGWCCRDHRASRGFHGGGDGSAAELSVSGRWRVCSQWCFLLLQEGLGEHRGWSGDPALLLRGAGLLEPPHPNQPELPLHQPPPHHHLGPRRLRTLLCPLPSQVSERQSSLTEWKQAHYINVRKRLFNVCVFLCCCRITLAIIGLTWLVIGTTLVGFLPESRYGNEP